MNQSSQPLSYKDAGVDIDAGDRLVDRIKPLARQTMRAGVMAGIGGFGAMFELPAGYSKPVLVSGTDGVGTKLRLAIELNRHDSIGIDLVAMSVNDILVQGAEPLYFLDYFACGKLDVDTAASVVSGIARGCELSGCALIGGETAEMPGMYADGDFDLAGFAVGAMERGMALPLPAKPGDTIFGLASTGVHSNGYSLVRKIVDTTGLGWEAKAPFADSTLGEALLTPTAIYVPQVMPGIRSGAIQALAHITGGGLTENLPRVLPDGLGAEIDLSAWSLPPVFQWLIEQSGLDEAEALRTFNCGIGMAVVARDGDAAEHALASTGAEVFRIGRITDNPGVSFSGSLT